MLSPGTRQWLQQVAEEVIDPDREIVDPHHHLWGGRQFPTAPDYELAELQLDTSSGHNVKKTVFVECNSAYRSTGPEHLMVVGETEYVAAIAQQSETNSGSLIAGIVAHANLLLGEAVEEVLDAHKDAGGGLYRGIRHSGAHCADDIGWLNAAQPDLFEQPSFREGLRVLGRRGESYDSWHYHLQNPGFIELAKAVPDTLMVLDHFGTPIGVGKYATHKESILADWKRNMRDLAKCENVVAKLGGLAMPPNGFGWHSRSSPATSDEIVLEQREYYLHMIDCFGPERCMFESNFPVDKMSASYPVIFNAFKKMVKDFSDSDQDALFSGTATRVYRL